MTISTLKKGPGTSWEVPGQNGLGPRDPQSPGTKTSCDLKTPKVPGLENGKVPGKCQH